MKTFPTISRIYPVLFTAACSVLFVFPTSGQEAPAQLTQRDVPTAPLLRPVDEYSSWTVSYSYADERDKASGGNAAPAPEYFALRPRQSVFVKTRDLIQETTTDLEGKITETWHLKGMQYRKRPGETLWSQVLPGRDGAVNAEYVPIPPSGYFGLDWINAGNFAGSLAIDGTECLVFVYGAGTDLAESNRTNSTTLSQERFVGYIDEQTRRPVSVRLGGEVRTYEFHSPPTTMLVFPADLTGQLEQAKAGRARLYTQPKRPY